VRWDQKSGWTRIRREVQIDIYRVSMRLFCFKGAVQSSGGKGGTSERSRE
jgi:hypothetical protein